MNDNHERIGTVVPSTKELGTIILQIPILAFVEKLLNIFVISQHFYSVNILLLDLPCRISAFISILAINSIYVYLDERK